MNRPAPTTPQSPAPETLRSDARTIGLIGLAHGSSHFFHLLLPPLFPWLIKDFGYSYAELSVLVSLFFVVSGTGQALAGFAVDRFGARPILFAALGSFAVAGLIASSAQPILPDSPCTENAWPMRCCETRLLRMVKSTGWNGALPRPAKNEAARSIA